MSRILLLLTALAAGCGNAAPASPPTPRGEGLVLLPSERASVGPEQADERLYFHDFGRVREGEHVSHVFRLENRDPEPVTIVRIQAGCGCTVPRVRYVSSTGEVVEGKIVATGAEDLLVVPPGAIAEIEIAVDTDLMTTKNGDKTLVTTVTTDSPSRLYFQLETHIFVFRPFDLIPNGINFGRVAVNAEAVGSCDIVQVPGSTASIDRILSSPEGIEVELEEIVTARPVWRLHARMAPSTDGRMGRITGEVVLATTENGEPADDIVVELQADRVEDIIANPTRLVFVARDTESHADVVVSTLLRGHAFRIDRARFEEPAHAELLDAEFEPETESVGDAAAAWRLRLTSKSPEAISELVRGTLVLELDDPQHPEVEVGFVVHPRASR